MQHTLFLRNRHTNILLTLLLLALMLGLLRTQAQATQSSQSKTVQAANGPAVLFPNNATASVSNWTPTEITAQVPLNTTDGDVLVTAVQGNSNTSPFNLGTSSVPDASGQASTWTTEFNGGTISTDTYWDEDILIRGDVTIAANITLTITPGVTVFFTAGSDAQSSGDFTDKVEIDVRGTLIAEGTQENPIYFISNAPNPAPQDWGHIKTLLGSNLSMSHCMVQHADRGVHFRYYTEGGGVLNGTINNCVFSENRTGLFMLADPGYPIGGTLTVLASFENNLIQNNIDYGIYIRNQVGYGNIVNTLLIQNNVIEDNDTGLYIKSGSWWLGHLDTYTSILNNTIRNNNTVGLFVDAYGSSDGSGSDTDVKPVIKYNLLENNNTNILLLLDPQGSDGTQIFNPTIQYNSILNANNGILIEDTEPYDTLNPTIKNNIFWGFESVGDYAINNQTNRPISTQDDYWGNNAAAWDNGPQAGDTNGTVSVSSFLNSNDNPILSRLAPAQAETGVEVTLFGANFGQVLVQTFTQYLPFITNPATFGPITINSATIPSRPVTDNGEVFYTTDVNIGTDLPSNGTFYLSSASDTLVAAGVDDEVVILLNGIELFTYTYGQPGLGILPVIIEVPRPVMTIIAGKTATVEFRDVYGDKVGATEMYLIWVP